MPSGRLSTLAETLKSQGVDPGDLASLQMELDLIESPPGLFARLGKKAKTAAAEQWKHIVGELQESREVMGILARSVRADSKPSPEEADKVRAQLLDLLRVVPAGIIAVANTALPVPGTGVFTPWILARLGLMPSRWRESHLLHQLHEESTRLRVAGEHTAADAIDAEHDRIEEEADAREAAERNAALLTYWDANENGKWDDDERAAYGQACRDLIDLARESGSQKLWYLHLEGKIFGPVRLSHLIEASLPATLLVCFDGKSGWVGVDEVLEKLK